MIGTSEVQAVRLGAREVVGAFRGSAAVLLGGGAGAGGPLAGWLAAVGESGPYLVVAPIDTD